jgi:hypothetical protein
VYHCHLQLYTARSCALRDCVMSYISYVHTTYHATRSSYYEHVSRRLSYMSFSHEDELNDLLVTSSLHSKVE